MRQGRSYDEERPVLIRTVAETGSTNSDMAVLAREGATEGLWLRAERQSHGRGRQGRSWESPPGNLYASTLVRLRPDDPPAATLALVAAVALQELIEDRANGAAVQIKWPNDLLIAGAKVSGILLERVDDAVVVGFGVNLDAYPSGTDRPATSLRTAAGSAPDAADFLEALASGFATWLERWRSEGIAAIRRRWLEKAHPPGTALAVSEGREGAVIKGLFDGIDEGGGLRLRLADGAVRTIQAGDIFLI